MKLNFYELRRALLKLWSSGFLWLSPLKVAAIMRCWWLCGPSFAFLASMACRRWQDRVALVDEEGVLSFAKLEQHYLCLALSLKAKYGLEEEARVGLLAGNGRSFILGLLAATRLGVNVLPLPPRMPLGVLEKTLARLKVSLVLYDQEFSESAGKLSIASASIDDYELYPAARLNLARAKKAGDLVVLTSGTSGIAKGISRRPTLGQVFPLFVALLASLPLRLHSPVVLAIPLYHGYGLASLAMALTIGAPLYLRRRYEIEPMLKRLEPEDKALLVSIPTLLRRYLQKAGAKPEAHLSLEAIITGSAPLDKNLCQELLAKLGPILYNLYGSTEAGLIALATPNALRQSPGSVGYPLPGNEVHIAALEGSFSPYGQIVVRGPFAIPSRLDGWRETGDLGSFDQYGHLYVHGRLDGMLISGGENVYPHEVEEVLSQHPALLEWVVIAVDDLEFGKRLEAVVVVRPQTKLSQTELQQWLKERLERHKLPRKLYFLESIPRNTLGKVDRVALSRELGA